MAIEVTTLLPAPTIELLSPTRIHFLDNLRATLTVLLIFQHAVLEMGNIDGGLPPKAQSLALSLFTTTNASMLWSSFFFVSGYSTTLALAVKSDWDFFLSRTLEIGLPALIYGAIGHLMLFLFLISKWEDIFGRFKAVWTFARYCGPVAYVAILVLFDYTYLFGRWIARRWLDLFAISFLESSSITPGQLYAIIAISAIILLLYTFFSCNLVGIPIRIVRFFNDLSYERVRPDAPIAYIIAYVAGIHFTTVQRYLFPSSSSLSWIGLLLSLSTAYFTMGIAQHLSPSLWNFIRLLKYFEPRRHFINAGFNPHTLFFVIWNAFVLYTIPFFLAAAFANTSWTQIEWGILARKTHFQTYIYMIPVMLAFYLLRQINNTILKAILVGILGTLGSWTMASPFFAYEVFSMRK